MKKNWIFALVIFLLALIIYGGLKTGSENTSSDSGVVKMGVILPLSGNSAVLGEPKKRAFEIALEQYNAEKERLQVVIEDNYGTPVGGTNAFNKMLLKNDFDCYYIDLTPVVNACIPIVDAHKVITFAGTAVAEVTNQSDYLFRIFAGGDQEIQMMVDFLHSNSIKSVYILHTNELFGTSAYHFFKKLYSGTEDKILGVDEYPMNNGDFKSQLAKAKASNAEKIILLGYGNEYTTLLKQAKEYNLKSDMFVCNLGGANNSVAELPAEFINGLTFIGPRFAYLLSTNSLTPKMKQFVDAYERKYNEKPYFHAAYAYDMITVFMDVYANGSKTKEQIMSDIKALKNYEGVSGTISFKENGDAETDLVTAKYINGSMELVK